MVRSLCGLLVATRRSTKKLKAPGHVCGWHSFWPGRLAVASIGGYIGIWELESGSCAERHDLGKPILAFCHGAGRGSLQCP